MTNERWLRWAISRYYRSIGYRVSMKPVKVGNAMKKKLPVVAETFQNSVSVFPLEDRDAKIMQKSYPTGVVSRHTGSLRVLSKPQIEYD